MADNSPNGGVALVGLGGLEDFVPVPASTKLYASLKRFLDIAISGSLLLLLIPVFLLLAAVIRIDSPGPALFRQRRIGKNGREFTIYKFRTMVVQAPAYSYKVALGDSRITRAGRWLRRTCLDELPQLWNVLRGDMSLIGPRPELPFIVDRYDGWKHPRHAVRPGITGWWQVHHRNDQPMHLNLDHDLYYLTHFSFALDLKIAAMTVKVMLTGLLARP